MLMSAMAARAPRASVGPRAHQIVEDWQTSQQMEQTERRARQNSFARKTSDTVTKDEIAIAFAKYSQFMDRSSTARYPSIREVLSNTSMRESFQLFLEKEYASENLLFWNEVEKFKGLAHSGALPKEIRAKAMEIYSVYIALNSDKQVNLSFATMDALSTLLNQTPPADTPPVEIKAELFNDAQNEIVKLLQEHSLTRWLWATNWRDLWLYDQETSETGHKAPSIELTKCHTTFCKLFQQYLQALGQSRLQNFLQETSDFSTHTPTEQQEMALALYARYIEDAADERIVFPSDIRAELVRTIRGSLTLPPYTFDRARDWVSKQEQKYHQLWLLTREWKKLVTSGNLDHSIPLYCLA
ncbi:regulator of G-protein signaling 9 [Pelomyxa schiedti]|nr:regulator of G-protein signaling 9 [Pelomyxa schiedti]